MAKSRTLTQKESDARRNVKLASFKFPVEFIEHLKQLAQDQNISQTQLIIQAVQHWEESIKPTGQ